MPDTSPAESVREHVLQEYITPRWTSYLPGLTALAALGVAAVLAVLAKNQAVPLWLPLSLALLAFCCEFVDSSLGMGYGTTLTPILLLMGYELKIIVPVVLLSEFLAGMVAGGFHHVLGNVDFKLKSRDSNIVAVLAGAGIFGALVAVQFLTRVPTFYAKVYFALMITAMGVIILARRNGKYGFSWSKVVGLGLLGSFNKGMSGGGYGPLVVGGQVLSGCEAKSAVGCTSLAESLVCLVALIGFAASGIFPTWTLAVPIVLGAMLSAPCAAAMTRHLDSKIDLKRVIGFVVLLLGFLCIYKVLIG
ncbi:MAG: sulfite exporter TauE/SafE family protein [Proteobacteria bacterium]|nr:sulfite exporter TauE/SafE family protein [Pseudomonadota bacterium]